ncbi:unnamed protein product [Dibothriocephalus latus]|uniref:Uncharacterized protein n=1 Tax=Dibothriocephalus latus TaxID=60516 RepID=A0A3P7NLF2_DIBLA|nr:unnamed protein product [Dibothriocephalus latus]
MNPKTVDIMEEQLSLWSVSDLVDSSSTKSQDGQSWPAFAPLGFSKVFLNHLKSVIGSEGGNVHNPDDLLPANNANSFYDEVPTACLASPQATLPPNNQLLTLDVQFLVSRQKQEAEGENHTGISTKCRENACLVVAGSSQQMMMNTEQASTIRNQQAAKN